MKPFLILLLAALPILSGCAPGPGAACRPEPVAELPLRLIDKVPVLDVQINGRPATLVLDTGSDSTLLSRQAAARLGVAPGRSVGMTGAGGRLTVSQARLATLSIGPIQLTNVAGFLADRPDPPLDGLLGINVLVDYEIALDLPSRRVTFYRARNCIAAAPDWTGPVVRLPVHQQAGSGQLFASVTVDGEPLRGMLDTGASRTTLSIQSSEDTGFGHRKLALLPAGRGQSVNPEGVLQRTRTFREMRIGDDRIDQPTLMIGDLSATAGDLLIGEDYLGTRRVWFNFLIGRAFVAP